MSYYTHHGTGTRLYSIWKSMRCRCYTASHPTFKNYGARGITICDAWKDDFVTFRDWAINNGYNEHLELDRIDVNGNYCPENCRWITHHEQTLNRRDTLYAEFENYRKPLQIFCQEFNLKRNSVKEWRQYGSLEAKIYEKTGITVKITGGKGVKVKYEGSS